MSKKKKHAEHVNHERWLVSWADLLTLLFAFFVVMFASSASDKKKAARMAAAMQTAFQQTGVFDAHAKTPPLAPGAGTSDGAPMPLEMPLETPTVEGSKSDGKRDDVRSEMAKALAVAVQQHVVTIRSNDEGTTLSLDSAGFFDSGSAEVKPSALAILTKIAKALPTCPTRIEGHTDNQPIHTVQFRSNWELSTARAASIAQVLMMSSINSPANFSLAGYGEFHPIAGNNTAEGRAANRRVDIVLLRTKATIPVTSNNHNATEKPRSISASEAPPLPFAMKTISSREAPSR
ncbi:flagellar motor protein MotB [Terriglobus roseus]|uniref:Chemotaxis protein MotB n=1 Tax=Terriglobus roseus TaxID=392734 RepID=A0A1G7KDX4_9BACT|nr:flagellar motor protein MotB [Terriglobus roseus]SDF35039.1 chemotaxis protein MotB [Terriglobus roseus]